MQRQPSVRAAPLPLPLLLPLCALLLAPRAAALMSSYRCPVGTQRILTNYGGYSFQLDLAPANGTYLQPNMDCGILIVGYSTSRWLITVESSSLGAYQAEFSIYEGSNSSGKRVTTVTAAGPTYSQVAPDSGSFYVRLTTKSGPAGLATGAKLTVEYLGPTTCPTGWYTVTGSSGYCYGVPLGAGNLTYDEAAKACNMVLANLVMGNFNYDSISSELRFAPTSVLSPASAYWVGLYEKDGDLKFLNKYTPMDVISGRMCSQSSSTCQCVAYQNGKFYRDDCNSKRQYVCYMPLGGTSSYYSASSFIATASAAIAVVAIVVIVVFVMLVVISLVVVLICCLRRRSDMRENRRRAAAANVAGGGGFVLGVGVTSASVAAPAGQPPPYPVQAPPYSAPAYANVAFVSGEPAGVGFGGPYAAEKPPAYNPDWSGQRVPA